MNTWFFSSSRAGCLGVLAAAGLISMVSPALALNIYPVDTMDTPSVSPVSSNPAISQEKLDGLLAPIALYPDALLAQVLMASTYPVDVMEAARWQQENPNLSDQALQDALASFDWDPSVKSLVTVPQVLQHMAKSPRWMQSLGRVVIDDQEWVMVSVQELRKKAHAAGTLTSNEQQTVGVEADAASGVEYVTIAPASPQVVYVPVYDPYVVYGGWWWPSRPYYWGPSYGITFSSGYYWGSHYYPSMALWGGFNWGLGAMIINVPVYRSYYRASPPSRPHNVWHPSPTYRRSVGAPSYRYYRPAAQRSGVVGSAAPSSSAVGRSSTEPRGARPARPSRSTEPRPMRSPEQRPMRPRQQGAVRPSEQTAERVTEQRVERVAEQRLARSSGQPVARNSSEPRQTYSAESPRQSARSSDRSETRTRNSGQESSYSSSYSSSRSSSSSSSSSWSSGRGSSGGSSWRSGGGGQRSEGGSFSQRGGGRQR